MKYLKQQKPETPLAQKAELDELKDELSQFKVELESKIEESKEETQELITKVADSVENLQIPEELDKDELSESILAKVPVPEPLDIKDLERNILAKVPIYKEVDEDKLVKKVLKAIPENKASLKIIQEKFETDPMSVIDKILKMGKKFKLKPENIEGLDQTIESFNKQLKPGVGYLHGGGDTVTAGDNITITTNAQGQKVISSTGGGAVDSVNGQTGVVVLDADDIGAVPYTGATADVDLGVNDLLVREIRDSSDGSLSLDANARQLVSIGDIQVLNWYDGVVKLANQSNGTYGIFDTSSLTADQTYTLPDQTGTLALTSDIPPAGISETLAIAYAIAL